MKDWSSTRITFYQKSSRNLKFPIEPLLMGRLVKWVKEMYVQTLLWVQEDIYNSTVNVLVPHIPLRGYHQTLLYHSLSIGHNIVDFIIIFIEERLTFFGLLTISSYQRVEIPQENSTREISREQMDIGSTVFATTHLRNRDTANHWEMLQHCITTWELRDSKKNFPTVFCG